jgi:hypothetical protein
MFIPLIGLDGDMLLKQGTRFGGGKTALRVAGSYGSQQTVNGRCGYCFKPFTGFWSDAVVKGKPQGDHGFETFATCQVACLPETLEEAKNIGMSVQWRRSGPTVRSWSLALWPSI